MVVRWALVVFLCLGGILLAEDKLPRYEYHHDHWDYISSASKTTHYGPGVYFIVDKKGYAKEFVTLFWLQLIDSGVATNASK